MTIKFNPRKNTRVFAIVVTVMLATITILCISYPTGRTSTTTATTTSTTTLPGPRISTGKLAVAVKDEQHSLPGGTTVLGMQIKIGNITVHYLGNETGNRSEWVVVSSAVKQLNLLDYTDTLAVIGQSEMEAGKYTQIRMYIESANITIRNTYFKIYSGKTYEMIIPSSELKTAHPFYVNESKTTVLTVDFDIENSVTHADIGYLLKPAVKITGQTMDYGKLPANSEVIE